MGDTIAVIFGMTFVGVILVCLVWTIGNYIFNNIDSQNKKLLNNMNKLKTKEKL
jgi:hypothetical protein